MIESEEILNHKEAAKMKKLIPILILVLLALTCLVGCSKYTSRYSAVLLISTGTSKAGSISFTSFSGTKVFKLKSSGQLNYSAELGTGAATVYYDCNGTKIQLFSIGAGQKVGPSSIAVTPGTVYVIVETDGKCQDGKFSFDVK